VKKYSKFIPHLLIIIFSFTIILCDFKTQTIDKDVIYSVLINEKGIGDKIATQVVDCLSDSNLIKMNLNNNINSIIKFISIMGIVFSSLYLFKKDVKYINLQSHDGHKNTHELLLDLSNVLEREDG